MPRNNLGEITKTWVFESSSGRGVYETCQYVTGELSCNCFGWTRRIDKQGQRSCKHTRMVEQGVADRHAESFKSYSTVRGRQESQPQGRYEPTPVGAFSSTFKPAKPVEEAPEKPKSRFRKVDVPVADDIVDVDEDRFKRL